MGLLQKIAKRKSDPRLYADELGKGFVGELDYTLEAANALKFRVIADISVGAYYVYILMSSRNWEIWHIDEIFY